jgi:EH domain-containing protein 1
MYAHVLLHAVLGCAQVYIGSFNSDAPINAAKNPHCVELFKAEQQQLLADLYEIPSRSCDRKVGDKTETWC